MSDLILCMDANGDPMPYSKALGIVHSQAVKVHRRFPCESFDVSDIEQEILIALLPHIPFKHPGTLSLAAKYKGLDFYKALNLVKSDRGLKHKIRYDGVVNKDGETVVLNELGHNESPWRSVDLIDLFSWLETQLHKDDYALLCARCEHGAVKQLADKLGLSESALAVRWRNLKPQIQALINAEPKRKERAHIRRSSTHTQLRTEDCEQVARQRLNSILASAR